MKKQWMQLCSNKIVASLMYFCNSRLQLSVESN